MDIHIKISDEQVKRLQDFGLGSILDNVMKGLGDDVLKDMDMFEKKGRPRWFFDKPKMPFGRFHFPSKIISEDKRTLTPEEIKSMEDVAKKELYNEVKNLFEVKKKSYLLKLVLERLGPHSLALLVQK
ncbi:hypothetical protein LCGC14_0687860 [marine sediment metagenome]|uniref:Uncharacterized protein n=1 Tax=marine sediment metagenome TaxID=412755 RepID=A0A0F9QLB9_9ZZZZ